MSDNFSFALDESARLARKILKRAVSLDLDYWGDVMKSHVNAKRDLGAALGPTWRRVVPYVHELSEQARWEAYALGWSKANDLAYDRWRTVNDREWCMRDSAGNPDVDKTADTRRKATALCKCLNAIATHFSTWIGAALMSDACAGVVQAASPLIALAPGIKPGQKMTRALACYFRASGISADDAALAVDAITSAAQATPRTGNVVLSVNILDYILMSEHCSYSSCHDLENCHRAGPQQQAQDGCTVVAYYYEKHAPYKGENLPYKLNRQLVYVDATGGCAAIQRLYGARVPDSLLLAIRRETACLLSRLRNPDAQGEPRWIHAEPSAGKHHYSQPSNDLAYQDPPSHFVSLASGKRPRIKTNVKTPCASCGGNLDVADQLVCTECGEPPCKCENCGRRMDEDEGHTNDDGETYCDRCWRQDHTYCNGCSEWFPDEDCNDGYCETCFSDHFTFCVHCDEHFPSDDAREIEGHDGPFCPGCHGELTVDCDSCSDTFHRDDLTDGHCEECWVDESRRRRLAVRLHSSPRWLACATTFDRLCFLHAWARALDVHHAYAADYLPSEATTIAS